MIAYHRSKTPVKKWDESKQRAGYYAGLYVSTNKEKFKHHGNFIYQFDLTDANLIDEIDIDKISEKLIDISNKHGFHISNASGYWISRALDVLGYDGINRGINGLEIILFNPSKFFSQKILINEKIL